jgi:hypothetical protein
VNSGLATKVIPGSASGRIYQFVFAVHFRQSAGTMKITEDVRKYAAEQGIAEEEALKKGMEQKSREFAEAGAELYSKA